EEQVGRAWRLRDQSAGSLTPAEQDACVMSASQPPAAPNPGSAPASDPSMEDILASIRRILSEDEAPAEAAISSPRPAGPPSGEGGGNGVLVLDPAMMVPEPVRVAPGPDVVAPPPVAMAVPDLVAPEAAAAAASSVDHLVRTLAAERATQIRAGGPTI